MKTACDRGILVMSLGNPRPASVWCFEPVCQSGRTLSLAQRSVAFRRKAEEHEKECLVSFRVPPGGKRSDYADSILALLRHRCP